MQAQIPGFPNRGDPDQDPQWGFAGGTFGWQQSESFSASEEFADMFIGWTYDSWDNDVTTGYGKARNNFMTTMMPEWIYIVVQN